MKHKHAFEVILREILSNDEFKLTQECVGCGLQQTQVSKTGDWLVI